MATIVGNYVGTAIGNYIAPGVGGAIGGAIGSAAGAYIDNKYLFPKIAGDGGLGAEIVSPVGPRVGGLQIQSSAEGGPMAFVLGPTNRFAGQIIWTSGLIEEIVTETSETARPNSDSGKLIPRSKTVIENNIVGYNYFADFAIGLCEGICTRLDKIIANGEVIYQNPELTNIVSDGIRANAESVGGANFVRVIATVASGVDLSVFQSGKEMIMSGWTASILNDTWVIGSSGTNTATSETFVTLQNETNSSGSEAAGNTITLQENTDAFDPNQIFDVRFYPGDLVQTADPLIESKEGTGNVPTFRGTCYVVIEKIHLINFGNQFPQMQFIVQRTATETVAGGIDKILTRAGLDSSEFDASVATDVLQGFHALGPQPAVELLIPLMRFANLHAFERNGAIIFKKKDDPTVELIKDGDFAASPGRDNTIQRPFEISDTFGPDLPSEIIVKFIEPKQAFQEAAQRERRVDVPNNTSVIFNVPIVMSAAEARTIARRELWSAWQRRQAITFSLPIAYIDLEENDKVNLNFEDETYTVLTKKIDRGKDHVLLIEGVVEDIRTNVQVGEEDNTNQNLTRAVFQGGTLLFEIIDIAPFTNDQNHSPGVYMAVAKIDPTAEFNSAQIFKSDDGQNFFYKGSIFQESTMGFVPVAVPAGPVGYFDNGTTIDVTLVNGTLESVTEEEMLEGANTCIIGEEVLQFQNAVLIDTNIYTISKLLRGRRDTADEVAHTQTDERFILLDIGRVQFNEVAISEINFDRFFKAVPPNVLPGQVPGFSLLPLEANTIQGFSPVHITGIRNTANDLRILWKRATRALVKHFVVGTTTPLLENREIFQIDFFDAGFTVIVDTITVEGPWPVDRPQLPEFTFTAADQTAAGLAPGADVNMIIYQLTEIKQRGKGKAATL